MKGPIHALIPAAGQSVRFGGTTLKQYAHLLGKPVISHSIEAIRSHPKVRNVTVALAEDDGMEFGAHTVSHAPLARLSIAESTLIPSKGGSAWARQSSRRSFKTG